MLSSQAQKSCLAAYAVVLATALNLFFEYLGLKMTSESFLALDSPTYANPAANSVSPKSIMTFSTVSPWHLWIDTANASVKGI